MNGSATVTKATKSYDYQERRTTKKVYSWDVPTNDWKLTKSERFVYNGYKCIAKLDALNSDYVIRKYTWAGKPIIEFNSKDYIMQAEGYPFK